MSTNKAKKAKEKEKSKERKASKLEKVSKLENVQLLAYDRYLKRKRQDGRASSRKLARGRTRTSREAEH